MRLLHGSHTDSCRSEVSLNHVEVLSDLRLESCSLSECLLDHGSCKILVDVVSCSFKEDLVVDELWEGDVLS